MEAGARGALGVRLFQCGVLSLLAVVSDWAVRSPLRLWVEHYWDEALVVLSWVVTGLLWLRVREMRREREEFFRRFVEAWSQPAPLRAPVPEDKGKGKA